MKSYLFTFTFILSFFLVKAQSPTVLKHVWSTDTILKTPESALYYKSLNQIFVTNMNTIHDSIQDADGFISIVSLEGKVTTLKWVTGLDDPKGMAEYKGKLYVGDLKHLVEIDIAKGLILNKYTIEGALFLNDVAVDANGIVYVTDSFANKVYRLKAGKLEIWIETGLNKPNGIYISKNLILIANMNEGIVYKVNQSNKKLEKWCEKLPSADGIVMDKQNNFFVSNWHGEVYRVSSSGTNTKVLDTKAYKINSADIEYIPDKDLLIVPTFFGNHLSAYKVNTK